MITYVAGDATVPQDDLPNKLILHICNNEGAWGAGFVLAVSAKWSEPERMYRTRAREGELALGTVQFVLAERTVEPDTATFVGNMVAQRGLPTREQREVVSYGALDICLAMVRGFITDNENLSVHMPRIGCGIAGGKWSQIEPLIEKHLHDVPVYVYDLVPFTGE